jgi:hypothetical protein
VSAQGLFQFECYVLIHSATLYFESNSVSSFEGVQILQQLLSIFHSFAVDGGDDIADGEVGEGGGFSAEQACDDDAGRCARSHRCGEWSVEVDDEDAERGDEVGPGVDEIGEAVKGGSRGYRAGRCGDLLAVAEQLHLQGLTLRVEIEEGNVLGQGGDGGDDDSGPVILMTRNRC